jgi:ppGpp synthetase/RelA/SpoT-type nucleotidyltranferase
MTNDPRQRWMAEKKVYEEIGFEVRELLSSLLKENGIFAAFSHRAKETDSLIKKIMRKGKSYDEILDKVGVRVVVSFKNQLYQVDSLICQAFKGEILKRENMSEKLGKAEFGYLAVHYDICRIRNDQEYICEVQLRTICQDGWSMLSHAIAYKTEIGIPLHIEREINALSAVFELADNQFQHIKSLIDELPDTDPIRILNFLEKFFISKIGKAYDYELSRYFLKSVNVLYEDNPILALQKFIEENEELLLSVISKYSNNIFFTQPEIILILERLENKKYALIEYWEERFPIEELESIANAWGISIE